MIRNTPFLVQIFFIFFALPLVGLRLEPDADAIIALGVNGGAYAIEIIRAGVAVDPQGPDRGRARARPAPAQVFRLIVLKPALRAIYPVADQPVHPADADHQHLPPRSRPTN